MVFCCLKILYNDEMTIITIAFVIAVFMLGAIMGSFLNVVAVDFIKLYKRHGLEEKNEFVEFWKILTSKEFWKKTVDRRSACDTCEVQLTPPELVPVVSYLVQQGKCKHCKTPFAPQHLYMELICGVLFAGIFLSIFASYIAFTPMFLFELLYMFVFFSFAMVLFMFDYSEQVIPDLLVYPMLVLAIVAHAFNFGSLPPVSIIDSILGAIIVGLPLFVLWLISQGKWIGLADAKLAAVMGALLGVSLGMSSVIMSFWIGAAVAIILMIKSKVLKNNDITAKTAVAFGPFMILGLWFTYVSGINVFPL